MPRSNALAQSCGSANGLWLARGVPSGGCGTSQSPDVDVSRADSRNAARHTGSRHALAIIEPFHSLNTRAWHVWHCAG